MTAALTTAAAAPPNAVHGTGFGSIVAGVVTSCLGAVGVWVGLLAMFATVRPLHVGWLVPLSGVYLALDPLGGFFVALTGGVAVPVGLYAIGYARREHLGRVPLGVLPVFVAGARHRLRAPGARQRVLGVGAYPSGIAPAPS